MPTRPDDPALSLAPLCRVLYNDVLATMPDDDGPFANLRDEWKKALFPDVTDKSFADAYAQSFTYALLLARVKAGSDAPTPFTVTDAITALNGENALLSSILKVLNFEDARALVEVPVGWLEQYIGALDPGTFSHQAALAVGDEVYTTADPWLYFYENFLKHYNGELRKDRGVFYTPLHIVNAQVRWCNELLKRSLGKDYGFASEGVVTLDPAAGTGTYPIAVVRKAAATALEQGLASSTVATDLAKRLHAFELLVGPYTVTHLRLGQAILSEGGTLPPTGASVFLTDTLSTPDDDAVRQVSLWVKTVAEEQQRASKIKSGTAVHVVLGNPPYSRQNEKSGSTTGKGGWIRFGRDGEPPKISDFIAPMQAIGLGGKVGNSVYNDYLYFWRWAMWKVAEEYPDDGGVVSFITPSTFVSSEVLGGVRQVMRNLFDEIWVVDVGGGMRANPGDSNILNITLPLAITTLLRYPAAVRRGSPAEVYYRRVEGTGAEKMRGLAAIPELKVGEEWVHVTTTGVTSFSPEFGGVYHSLPEVNNLLPLVHQGAEFKRTWPISESQDVLTERWAKLMSAPPTERAGLLVETDSRKVGKSQASFLTTKTLPAIFMEPANATPDRIVRYNFRSFDRQYCIADNRLIDRHSPSMWSVYDPHQIWLDTRHSHLPPKGSAGSVSANPFDRHHFANNSGVKNAYPLYRDKTNTNPNITAGLLELLTVQYKKEVTAEDFFSYLYGMLGTAAFTDTFGDTLRDDTLRAPITKDSALFLAMSSLGRELIWWHTFGERLPPTDVDGSTLAFRPGVGSTIKESQAKPIPTDCLPATRSYDATRQVIVVGAGEIEGVSPEVWAFNTGGMDVVNTWLGYRMDNRAGRGSSTLDHLRTSTWTITQTLELLTLLNIIRRTIELTPKAKENLGLILKGPCFTPAELPIPTAAERSPIAADDPDRLRINFDLPEDPEVTA